MEVVLTILFAGWAFVSIILLVDILTGKRNAVKRRIDKISDKTGNEFIIKKDKKEKKSVLGTLSFFSKGKILEKIKSELSLAAIPLKAQEFLFIWIILAFVPAGIVALFSFNLFVCIALVTIGTSILPIILKSSKKKRMALFNKQLSDALAIMSNCLKAGFSLQQSMESISDEMPEPISKEFSRTLREVKYGITMENALTNMVERIKNPDLDMIVSAILIQRQVGGNLSEILVTISETIKDRIKIKDEIRVLTSSARTSGMIIGLLPVFIMMILMLINPDYIGMFFNTQIGIAMLIAAFVLETIGFLIVKKIVSVKF